MASQQYKIVLLGISGTGKTTYLQRLFNEGFEQRLLPSRQPGFYQINFHGQDMIVQEIPGTLMISDTSMDHHLGSAQGTIIFYDDREVSYRRAQQWKKKFLQLSNGPVLMIQNKSDVKILDHDNDFTISVKQGLSLSKPLEKMAQLL